MTDFIKYVEDYQLGDIYLDVDLREHSSMRVGGTCAIMYIPSTIGHLQMVVKYISDHKLKHKYIGRGSNIVFADGHLNMIMIKISNVFNNLEIGEEFITVGSGYSMMKFAKEMSKKGYAGLEFAGGIPGTIGGAVYMNAGAHLKEVSSLIHDVDAIDASGNLVTLTNEECNFSYRESTFHNQGYVIVSARFKIIVEDKAVVFKHMSGNLEYRKEMQPLEFPSCGSSFRNPPGEHAGKLIENCGLKGYEIGGAKVSEKHANFIINTGNATASDIIELVSHIQAIVYEETQVKLRAEMEFVKEV